MTLIQTNVLRRNIDRACRYEVDLGGASYYLPAGAAEDGPRSRNPVWQNYAMEYLWSGTAVVIARLPPREEGASVRKLSESSKAGRRSGAPIAMSFGGRNRSVAVSTISISYRSPGWPLLRQSSWWSSRRCS